MDFGTVLNDAHKNTLNVNKQIKYYSTKFEPPKKEQREQCSKTLSANIQKFLAKREEEEKQKTADANDRRQHLVNLRSKDKAATRRVNVMLKRTKSYNQSVIQDAADQPDQDDYGHVSQYASEFYYKLMEKYSKRPDEQKCNLDQKKVSTNSSITKDSRKRKSDNGDYGREAKVKKPVHPPVMNFSDLLKIAEKKQFEPIIVKQSENEGRLMTQKQKLEMEREKELKEAKQKRDRARLNAPVPAPLKRIPKLQKDGNESKTEGERLPQSQKPEDKFKVLQQLTKPAEERNGKRYEPDSKDSKKRTSVSSAVAKVRPEHQSSKPIEIPPRDLKKPVDRSNTSKKVLNGHKSKQNPPNDLKLNQFQSKDIRPKELPPIDIRAKESSPRDIRAKELPSSDIRPKQFPPSDIRPKQFPPSDIRPKQFPPSDIRPKQFSSSDIRPKQFPPSDIRPKQFPPSDIRPKQFPPKDLKEKRFPPKDVRRKPKPAIRKGKFYDDDSEYDSEIEDFVIDGPSEEDEVDVSEHIRKIFGYDKRKYDDIDCDVGNMETSFAQQQREEARSAKIGRRDDQEALRLEEEHKKRKAMMKRKYK